MGISQLTGTPWHIETLHTNDERRHRARCGYYRNGYCYCYYENCHGSARCEAYNVKAVIPEQTDSSVSSKEHQPLKKRTEPKVYPNISEVFGIGDKVAKRYFVDGVCKRRGGIIVDIDSNNYVTIEFTNKAKEHYTEVYKYPEMLRLIELQKKYDESKSNNPHRKKRKHSHH